MSQFVTSEIAVGCIKDYAALGISSFGGWLGTDELYYALRRRYVNEGHPRSLHIYGGILPGSLDTKDVGMNILACKGLVSAVTAAHVGMAPLFAKEIADGDISGYALPLGVFTKLLRAGSAHEPGIVSAVGIGTFCDPKLDGCCLNKSATALGYPVENTNYRGKRYLFYPSFKLDVCFVRASVADEEGNLSFSCEPITGDQVSMAMAVHNNGGTVIAQVSDVVRAGELQPKTVGLHCSMVDYVVVASAEHGAPGYDCADYGSELVSRICERELPAASISIDQRSICARRAALELRKGSIVNLGIGIPDGISEVAAQEGISNQITLSLESGPMGGVPVTGVGFGAARSPEAIYSLDDNFNFYDGGGLNMAFLGAGEIDEKGNVNVSAFSGRVTGPGGFINISQNTQEVFFLSSFTTGGLNLRTEGGTVSIVCEGKIHKLVKSVQQVTFSAEIAREKGQKVVYITERAVFELGTKGLVLTEIAPGVDLERDVLAQMDFAPEISANIKLMDARIFTKAKMGLKNQL